MYGASEIFNMPAWLEPVVFLFFYGYFIYPIVAGAIAGLICGKLLSGISAAGGTLTGLLVGIAGVFLHVVLSTVGLVTITVLLAVVAGTWISCRRRSERKPEPEVPRP